MKQASPIQAAVSSRAWRAVVSSVDRVPLVLLATFVAAAICVTFGAMFWWLFVPLSAVLVAVCWRAMPTPVAVERATIIGAAVAIAFALLWYLVNSPFASEYLVPIRDPGLYFLNGVIVGQTGGIDIDVRGAVDAVARFGDGTVSLGAFGAREGVVQLQGSSGFPALLAVGYWIGGLAGIAQVNLILGALGLVTLYGLSRRLLGPWFALLPPVLLSIGMPYIYLSRTTYTEILATLLLVASATWTISAFKTSRWREFAIAGAFVGAAGLTRIDGAVGFAGVALGVVVLLIGFLDRAELARVIKGLLLFLGVAIVLILLGILDLAINHVRYLVNLSDMAAQLWIGSGVLVASAAVLLLVRRRWRPEWGALAARRVALIAAGTLGVVFLFWLSRPSWMTSRRIGPDYQGEIAMLQAKDGLLMDAARSYDEYSLWWYAWYWGWPFLLLAAFGVCIWLYVTFKQRDGAQLIIIATIALTAMLYINTLRVTPDQVWAFRRILPIITPAMFIGFAMALRFLWRRTKTLRVLGVVGLALTLVFTGLSWGKIFVAVEGNGQIKEATAICDAVGDAELIVLMGPGTPPNYQATLRAVCGVQLLTLEGYQGIDLAPLVEIADGPVAVVTFDAELVDWQSSPPAPVAHTELHMWDRHLMKTPRTTQLSVRDVYVGLLTTDGVVVPAGAR